MGILHYLGRTHPDRALFQLGKFWYEPAVFFGETIGHKPSYQLALAPHDLLDETTMYGNILAKLERDGGMPAAKREPFALELARRITRFAGGHPVEFLNDASSDLDDYRGGNPDYPDGNDALRIVDSAYPADWKEIT